VFKLIYFIYLFII